MSTKRLSNAIAAFNAFNANSRPASWTWKTPAKNKSEKNVRAALDRAYSRSRDAIVNELNEARAAEKGS